jgi:hypothetical protein
MSGNVIEMLAICKGKWRLSREKRLPVSRGVQHRYTVFGQVVGVHIDDRFIRNGLLDTAAMKPIARCGYHQYAVVDAVFEMVRPTVPDAALPA